MSNMVKDVKDMNVAFGYPEGNFDDLTTNDWVGLHTQINCITEEVNETLDAIYANDKKELIDGICDICICYRSCP